MCCTEELLKIEAHRDIGNHTKLIRIKDELIVK